jgi:hypothetical protein
VLGLSDLRPVPRASRSPVRIRHPHAALRTRCPAGPELQVVEDGRRSAASPGRRSTPTSRTARSRSRSPSTWSPPRATPGQMERVPPGAIFESELLFTVYRSDDGYHRAGDGEAAATGGPRGHAAAGGRLPRLVGHPRLREGEVPAGARCAGGPWSYYRDPKGHPPEEVLWEGDDLADLLLDVYDDRRWPQPVWEGPMSVYSPSRLRPRGRLPPGRARASGTRRPPSWSTRTPCSAPCAPCGGCSTGRRPCGADLLPDGSRAPGSLRSSLQFRLPPGRARAVLPEAPARPSRAHGSPRSGRRCDWVSEALFVAWLSTRAPLRPELRTELHGRYGRGHRRTSASSLRSHVRKHCPDWQPDGRPVEGRPRPPGDPGRGHPRLGAVALRPAALRARAAACTCGWT